MLFGFVSGTTQAMAKLAENRALLTMVIGADICLQILQTILIWYIMLGIIRQCLYTARGGIGFQMNLMFPPFMMFLKMVGLMLILFIIMLLFLLPALGTLLIGALTGTLGEIIRSNHSIASVLFVGGLFLSLLVGYCAVIWINIRLYLAWIFIADQDAGIIDSMRYSWQASSGNFWMLLLASLVLGIGSMLGIFLCGVGLILTAAVMCLGIALVYLQLTGQPNCLDCPSFGEGAAIP
jgi:uncharacterized membrane protein